MKQASKQFVISALILTIICFSLCSAAFAGARGFSVLGPVSGLLGLNSASGEVNAIALFSPAASFTVNSLGDAADGVVNNGICETAAGNGVCTLRAAIQEANNLSNASGQIVDVNFSVTGTIQMTNAANNFYFINRSVRVNGPGANLLSVTAGSTTTSRIFHLNGNGTIGISGLQLQGGYYHPGFANDSGAGIYASGAMNLTIDGVLMNNNHAGIEGGAIYLSTGTFTIRNSAILGNNAQTCGAMIVTFGASMTMTNSTVSHNSSAERGGGICAYGSNTFINIRNSTLTANSTGIGGGGIHSYVASTLRLGNSIVAGNTTATGTRADVWIENNANLPVDEGCNLIGRIEGANERSATFTAGTPGANNNYIGTNAAPLPARLGPFDWNGAATPTHALLNGSLAIDKGKFIAGLTADQRGQPRPYDNTLVPAAPGGDGSDIGAFEAQTDLAPPVITVTGGPLAFPDTPAGMFSAEQAYTVSATNIYANLVVTAPSADFQVSTASGSGFGPSVSLAPAAEAVADTTIYVRFSPQAAGAKAGNISNSTLAGDTKNIAVSGNGILLLPGTLQFTSAAYGDNETNADHVYNVTVSRANGSTGAVSVGYTVSDGTAAAGSDYTAAASGTLNWADGDSAPKTIAVTVKGDLDFEPDETINLALTNPAGGAILGARASSVLTIVNDDAPPAFSIDDVSNTEGNSGTKIYTFTVTKTGATALAAAVDFTTQDGTATIAGSDYQANGGTLTFLPGDTAKTITVPVNGNFFIEPDETFTVQLSNSTGATISDESGAGTIVNDDAMPAVVYVDDDWAAVNIGDDPDGAGPANAFGYDAFKTVQDGINGVDVSGTVNVHNGVYDEDVNANKAGVQLLGESSAATSIRGPIGGAGATVQIAASNVTVAGFTVTRHGNNATDWNDPGLNSVGIAIQGPAITGAVIRDNLLTGNRAAIDINNSSGHTVRNNVIDFNRGGIVFRNQTENLTVTENFITNNWTWGIVFLDGSGGTNIPVQSALNSTFSNNGISANWYAQVVDRQAGGTLPAPGTVNTKNFKGNWYGTDAPVITTANSAEPGYAAQIPVAYGGSATPPGGQPDVAGPASANIKYGPQLLSGVDTDIETVPGRGTFGFQGVPNVPILNVADHAFTGVDSRGVPGGFLVTLTGDTTQTVTVHYQTANGTAVAGEDYAAAGGTLTFAPGETGKVIPVDILADTVQEETEQFSIALDNPVNAGILDGSAVGTIPNDDAGPIFSVGDVTLNEGNSGPTAFTFTITKTGGTVFPSTVNYNTVDGTASSASDYGVASGSVVFAAADITKTVTVLISGDVALEPDETFTLHLSGTDNGTIADADGSGTISNDDTAAIVRFAAAAYREDESQTAVITLARAGDTTVTSTVDVMATNAAATGAAACGVGADFINTAQTVTFAPGETLQTAAIPICVDAFPEIPETFNLALVNPGAPATIGAQGTAVVTINDTAGQYRGAAAITIGDHTPAGQYPATLAVSGASPTNGSVRVTLYDVTHGSPDDLDLLLVGPGGQKYILMGKAGGANALNGTTITFDDNAFQVLPDGNQIVTARYRPTSWISPVADFPTPAPAGPYTEPGSALPRGNSLRNIFGASNPNGDWQLFVRDNGVILPPLSPAGAVAGGWGLEFIAPTAALAEINGRVLTAGGRPIASVIVTLSGGSLSGPRTMQTGSLGIYRFTDLPVGQSYVVAVNTKRFSFLEPVRLIELGDSVTGADFLAEPRE